MLNDRLTEKVLANFPFPPTEDQKNAISKIVTFLFKPGDAENSVFILKGFAGTGKSVLVSAVVRALKSMRRPVFLMAPTGRAAKVFSSYASEQATTIHKKIYRQRSLASEDTSFSLSPNKCPEGSVFFVDEASMIGRSNSEGIFGSGDLLSDLFSYVFSGNRCKLVFIGDIAQLPPIGEDLSPALDAEKLENFISHVTEIQLEKVVRQIDSSSIFHNADLIRQAIFSSKNYFPNFNFNDGKEFLKIRGDELIECLSDAYARYSHDETTVICRSNKRANAYNKGIRNMIFMRESMLEKDDMLMITKNNYFWKPANEDLTYLANGEYVKVLKILHEEELYGKHFITANLKHIDSDTDFIAKLMTDVLNLETPSLPLDESKDLFWQINEDYADVKRKKDRYKKIRENEYFNALQIKYGYAVTCHKAQGGEWSVVFIDIGYIRPETMDRQFWRWLYTAVTRAKEKVIFVNPPKALCSED